METTKIRNKLKKCQPYFIERDLLPRLYFKEDAEEKEYWTFKYAFIRRLSDVSIGVRLGYTKQNIHYILKKILQANYAIIEEFLNTQEN